MTEVTNKEVTSRPVSLFVCCRTPPRSYVRTIERRSPLDRSSYNPSGPDDVWTSARPEFDLLIHAVRARPSHRCALLRDLEPWRAALKMLMGLIRMSCACAHVEAPCLRTDGPLFSATEASRMRRERSRACHRCPKPIAIYLVNTPSTLRCALHRKKPECENL